MADVAAIGVKSFEGNSVTDDGSHGLFHFRQEDGADVFLAIPHELLMPLMAALSHACAQSARIRDQDRNIKHVFACEWWNFYPDASGQHLILSFQVPGGMEMSFQVARDRITMMRETLQAMEGASPTDQPPETMRH